jgi:hypothetical protein
MAQQIQSYDRLVRKQLDGRGEHLIDAKTKSLMQKTAVNFLDHHSENFVTQIPSKKVVSPSALRTPELTEIGVDTRSLNKRKSFATTKTSFKLSKAKEPNIPNDERTKNDLSLI